MVGELTPYLQEKMAWRLYPMHGFFCACSFIVGKYSLDFQDRNAHIHEFSTVYPETKGVPLEEMDAVFGEGQEQVLRSHYWLYNASQIDEREEEYEDHFERGPFSSNNHSTNHRSLPSASQSSESAVGHGWLSRLFNRGANRYHPINAIQE
ncbi:hypothetical protein H0H81_012099 [Sphagnurus paluster]|uniref:Uncharacterized protein n=1 Tax=Sphagnurus paluster TaxID=117069 RepID=A0A9P7GVB9_9AGAR|nr:hypothetical protein H0H81_012099 [Sphagnurus paluster]